jgi:formylmethanofuran dehydrogenase subunit E
MDSKLVNLAIELHGHYAPGLALGLRMSELALEKLDAKRGDKELISICENRLCLADAIQVATGCTLGRRRIFLEDHGKLAFTLVYSKTKRGVRIALQEKAKDHSNLMNHWLTRMGKLSHEEEEALSLQMANLDEKYFRIQPVEVSQQRDSDKPPIVVCSKCKEALSSDLASTKESNVLCKACLGEGYYKVVEQKALEI